MRRRYLSIAISLAFGASGAALAESVVPNEGCDQGQAFESIRPLDPLRENPHMAKEQAIMHSEVIGQNEGVDSLLEAVSLSSTGLQDPKKPLGRYILLGPTGVGKTETANALVRSLGGGPDEHLTRIDCGEFQDDASISRIIGATAKYVGYGEKPMFHPDNFKKRQLPIRSPSGKSRLINVIAIDEIEQCADALIWLFMGVLDYGKVTLGDNTEVYLRSTIIIATSNLGADEVERKIQEKFQRLRSMDLSDASRDILDLTGRADPELRQQILDIYRGAVKAKYKPQFLNRFQRVIQYLHLGSEEMHQILTELLARVQKRIFESADIKLGLIVDPSARDRIVRRSGEFLGGSGEIHFPYGARELSDRVLDEELVRPLGRLVTTSQVREGDLVLLRALEDGTFAWDTVKEGFSREELLRFAAVTYPGYQLEKTQFDIVPQTTLTGKPDASPKARLIAYLNSNTDKLKDLYLKAGVSPVKLELRGEGSGGNKEVLLKFIKIDGELYEVRFDPSKDSHKIASALEIPKEYNERGQFSNLKNWTATEHGEEWKLTPAK